MSVNAISKDEVDRFASEFGFQSVKNAEKFMMNLRVHRILSDKMKCCLRGGLCTQFYATNPKSIRTSIDLDLFVEDAYDDASYRIVKILAGKGLKGIPRKKRKVQNLLQIDLRYDTERLLHGQKEHMKIDVLCGVDFNAFAKNIPSGHSTFAGNMEYDVIAVTRGCLIADKIASLAINGSGYKYEDKAPKQIHDIGYLLDEATVDELTESITVFKRITELKTGGIERGSSSSVIQHIINFLSRLPVVNGEIMLQENYLKNFSVFRQEYLSEQVDYSINDLKSNVLKTMLYATCAKKAVTGEITASTSAKIAHDAINGTIGSSDKIRAELEGMAISGGDTAIAPSKASLGVEAESNLQVLYGIWKLENW